MFYEQEIQNGKKIQFYLTRPCLWLMICRPLLEHVWGKQASYDINIFMADLIYNNAIHSKPFACYFKYGASKISKKMAQ